MTNRPVIQMPKLMRIMKASTLKKTRSTTQIIGNTPSEITIEVDLHSEEGTLADPPTPITGEQTELMTEKWYTCQEPSRA